MENDFKLFLALSFIVHAGIFGAFGLQSKRAVYIVMPIDLLLNNPQPQGQTAAAAPQAQPEIKKAKEKALVIPKKPKAEAPAPKKEASKPQEESKPAPEPAAPAKAAAQGFSGAISVDTAKFPYAYYTNLIVRKINRHWQWSNEFGKLRTVIFFKIEKDGSLSGETIKEDSGDRLFDEQAMRAVKLAGPFPPLPEGYPDSDLGVYFEFTFRE
jgi:protein TonB